ncbi:MAG TPA: hypothetical protein VHG93_15920 [Longimicrobium sp.]|nr:hypothetical protein [Longimicrobium sp.]
MTIDPMVMEAMAMASSAIAIAMCVLAFILYRRSPRPSRDRTITITVEDSTGARTRRVARSNRSVDEVMRLLERLVAQPS